MKIPKKNILFLTLFFLGIMGYNGIYIQLGSTSCFNALATQSTPASNTITTDLEMYEEDQTSILGNNFSSKYYSPISIYNNTSVQLPHLLFTIRQPPKLV